MDALSILLAAGVIGVIALMVIEIRGRRARRVVISGRQFVLRMVGGGILLALLAAIFVGDHVLGLGAPAGRATLFLAWWSGCLVLAVVLLLLAVYDLRYLEQRRRQREHEIWREFARTLAARIRRDRGEDKPDGADHHA